MLMKLFGNHTKVARSGSEITDLVIVEDLTSWEFVVPSDDDEPYSFNDEDLDSSDGESGTKRDEIALKQGDSTMSPLGSPSSDVSPAQIAAVAAVAFNDCESKFVAYDTSDDDDPAVDDDDDDCDDDYDFDDELVPYYASDKFVKQRMKKQKKMTCPKMNKPKRLPYYYNKPGAMWKIR